MKKKTIINLSRWLNYLSAFWCFSVGLSLIFFSPWLFLMNFNTSLDFVPFKLIGIMSIFIGIGYICTSKDLIKYNWYMWTMGVFLNGLIFLFETSLVLFYAGDYIYALHGLVSGFFTWAFLSLLVFNLGLLSLPALPEGFSASLTEKAK